MPKKQTSVANLRAYLGNQKRCTDCGISLRFLPGSTRLNGASRVLEFLKRPSDDREAPMTPERAEGVKESRTNSSLLYRFCFSL